MHYVFLNNKLLPAPAAMISVFDRGFAYGDALAETIKIRRGCPVFFEEHWQRLEQGAGTVGIGLGEAEGEGLKSQSLALAKANGVDAGRLRIQLSRGTPPQPEGPDPGMELPPTLVVTAEPFAGYPSPIYRQGISCRTVLLNRGHYAAVKSTSNMPSILARREAHAAGAREAILSSGDGRLLEGAFSNIFLLTGGKMFTASEADPILPGVIRGKVLDIARDVGIDTELAALRINEIDPHDSAAFLTGSLLGICPISEIDGTKLKLDLQTIDLLRERLEVLEEESVDRCRSAG